MMAPLGCRDLEHFRDSCTNAFEPTSDVFVLLHARTSMARFVQTCRTEVKAREPKIGKVLFSREGQPARLQGSAQRRPRANK